MLYRKKALLRATAPAAILALTLTACGPDDASDDAQGDKGQASQDAGNADSTEEEPEAESQEQNNGPMQIGDTAQGLHEYDMSDGKAKLEITAEKVETGKNADLLAAGLQEANVKGMYPVFVYFTYTVKEGSELDKPGFNRKARVLGEGNEPGKSLIAIGADPIKGGCPEDDAPQWKVGDTHTLCSTFVLPEGKDVEQVAWAGDLRNPLLWNVK